MENEEFLPQEPDTVEPEEVEYKAEVIDNNATSYETGSNGEIMPRSPQHGHTETLPLFPSIVIPTTPSVNVTSAESSVLSSSVASRYLITEAARFSTEIKRLNGELVVARKRIQEQDLELEQTRQEISLNEEILQEKEEIVIEQQRKIERMEEDNRNLESGVHADVKELKDLIGNERTRRLDTEAKYEQLRDSLKSLKEEFKQLIELLKDDEGRKYQSSTISGRRQDDEDEYEDIVPKENKLEALTMFVARKFATWTATQLKIKGELFSTQKLALSLTQVLNSKTTNDSTKKVAASEPAGRIPLKTVQQNHCTESNSPVLTSCPTPPSITPEVMQELQKFFTTRTMVTPKPKIAPGNKQHREDETKSGQGHFCVCGQQYSTRSNLITHVRTFTETGKFKCDICKVRFVLYCMLSRHEKEKHNINSKGLVGCALCGKVFTTFLALYAHRKIAHPQSGVTKKSVQSKRTSREDRIKNVENDAVDDAAVLDHEISKEKTSHGAHHPNTASPSSLRKYERIRLLSHGMDPSNNFRCLCGTEFSNIMNVFKHISYYKPKKFSCSKCSKRFISGKSLWSHNIREHRGKYQPMMGAVTGSKLGGGNHNRGRQTTTEVKRGYRRKNIATSSLDAHVLVQNQDQHQFTEVGGTSDKDEDKQTKRFDKIHGIDPTNPGQCLCGYKVGIKKLMGHVSYYAEKKTFICKDCPARFVGIWYLKRHMLRTHTNVNVNAITSGNVKTECGQCGKVLDNLKMFREHVKKVHPRDLGMSEMDESALRRTRPVTKRPRTPSVSKTNANAVPVQGPVRSLKKFACNRCDETYDEITHLNRHKLKMHNIRTLGFRIGCKACGLVFTTRSEFFRHRMDVHKLWVERDKNSRKPKILKVGCRRVSSESETSALSDEEESIISFSDVEEPTSSHRNPHRPSQTSSLFNKARTERTLSTSNLIIHKVDTSKAYLGYFCTCGDHFVEQKNLHSHIRRKAHEDTFICEVCDKYFYYNSTLRRHMLTVHKIEYVSTGKSKSLGCAICGNTYKHWDQLKRHRKLVHDLEDETEELSDQQTSPFGTCPSSPTPMDPEQPAHGVDVYRAHRGYYCLCGKKSSSERSLTVHIRYATKNQP